MAERQERRLMRQRGAGPRELKNAGFSFNFGAAPPLPPRESTRKTPRPSPAQVSRKTPRPSLAQRPSSRKTPAESGKRPASAARTRETSATFAQSSGSRDSGGNGRTFKTPVTTGKRKRDGAHSEAVAETEQDELQTTPEDIAALRSASIRPSIEVSASAQKTPVAKAGDEVDEPDELSPENDGPKIKTLVETPTLPRGLLEGRDRGRTHRSAESVSGSVILSSIEEDEVGEEDELSFQDNPTATNSAQASSGHHDSSSEAKATSATDGLSNQGTRQEVRETPAGEPVVGALPIIDDLDQDEEDELSPERTINSSRKSAHKLRVVVEDEEEEDELSPPNMNKPRRLGKEAREAPVVPAESVEDDVSEDELSPVQSKPHRLPQKAPIEPRGSKTHKRKRVEESSAGVHEDEAEAEVSEIDELSPQRARPAPKQKTRRPLSTATTNLPKKSKQTKKPADRATSPSRKKAKGDVIGITVYRRTESSNIAYEMLSSEPNPGITPVDVLAQVSSELADNHIAAFQQQSRKDNVSKKTRNRQVGVMQYFRDVLSTSLRNLQHANSEAYVLGKQLRGINKRKRQLREELMGRRREREELEVEIDRVRARHREVAEKGDREFELVQSLRDIEGAVRRGKEKAREEDREEEGPEVGIEMVVGSAKETLGLLGRIREWNGVLESSAQMLESRA